MSCGSTGTCSTSSPAGRSSVRYKQSVIGVFWAVLQPLLLAVVFSVFFGHLAKVPSDRASRTRRFAVSGMVLWLFFAGAMSQSSRAPSPTSG